MLAVALWLAVESEDTSLAGLTLGGVCPSLPEVGRQYR